MQIKGKRGNGGYRGVEKHYRAFSWGLGFTGDF